MHHVPLPDRLRWPLAAALLGLALLVYFGRSKRVVSRENDVAYGADLGAAEAEPVTEEPVG